VQVGGDEECSRVWASNRESGLGEEEEGNGKTETTSSSAILKKNGDTRRVVGGYI
jgi:hypothetical protein